MIRVVGPYLMETLVAVGIYVLALAATFSLRRAAREEGGPAPWAACLRGLIGFCALPAAVLMLSWLVLRLLRLNPVVGRWLLGHAAHVAGWNTFWMVVLAIAFLEGLGVEFYRLRGRTFPIPQLMRNLIRGLLLLLTAFAILRYQLGINIAPLLASTALVTAVVGFALQGVLGNLLGGMSLHLVRSVMPGDWVAIGDAEGEVIETNWRETRLRTVAGHILIIPNSTVASSVIHNMTRPTPLRRHTINVGASYSDAPGEVLDALRQAAAAVPEVLREPPPSAYVTEYKDFGINYRLRFWTNRYFDRTAVEGDVMRMIWYQFKRRYIEIPFPMSDKLLNDFMTVVFRQRRMPPENLEVQQTLRDLLRSDFVSKLVVDEAGRPLLSEDDLRGLAPCIRRIRYTAGETIFRQGDPGESCYVVVQGRVHGRVEYADVRQAHEFEISTGSLFGEMSLVSGLPRTATITAPGEVELLEISRETFVRLLALRKEIPDILARVVAQRSLENLRALEQLKALHHVNIAETLKRENLLTRFLHLLGMGG